jgi:hypothetical protein
MANKVVSPFLVLVPAVLLASSLACSLIPIGSKAPIKETSNPVGKVPTAAQAAQQLASPRPVTSPTEAYTATLSPAECDRLSFIEASPGEASVLPFSEICASDCKQAIVFTNTHPTERIKLFFLQKASVRPGTAGWTGEKWTQEVLGPGESVTKYQWNRTPHSGECPWTENDFSLVSAIPVGMECRWLDDAQASSLLPVQEVENQCR